MSADLYTRYTAVVFTIIALSLIVQLFFLAIMLHMSDDTKKSNTTVSTFQKTIEDLDRIVQRKCMTAYRRALEPFVNKALKNKPLINDKIVNELSIQITEEILEEMSDSYRAKLEEIYQADKVNDIILELVYNTVTEMSMSINKHSIYKMNIVNSFKNINKQDFDE